MVKIEVEVVDSGESNCKVTIKKPKYLKSSTETEKKTANVVKNTIDVAMENLSKTK